MFSNFVAYFEEKTCESEHSVRDYTKQSQFFFKNTFAEGSCLANFAKYSPAKSSRDTGILNDNHH